MRRSDAGFVADCEAPRGEAVLLVVVGGFGGGLGEGVLEGGADGVGEEGQRGLGPGGEGEEEGVGGEEGEEGGEFGAEVGWAVGAGLRGGGLVGLFCLFLREEEGGGAYPRVA